MKTAFYSLVLTAFVILPLRADLTIVYSTTVQPASQGQKVQATPSAVAATNMTIKVKGDKARIDASPEMAAIFDGRTGELINLLNDQKTVVRISPNKMRAIADMLTSSAATKQGRTNPDSHPPARGK
jgi:ABC-type enterochelin transport system substrate-binding protein